MSEIIKKYLISTLFFVLPAFVVNATHNRAGEITYKHISDLTYEITITTFTYTLSKADRPELEVQWGDNSTSIAKRATILWLPNFYKRNTYIIEHTFPGPGTYEIVVQDPNRNDLIINIPNSVNVVFSIKTTMVINPMLGYNNTPLLLNPPIDKAAIGRIFIHNPAAFDADGDSISYKLTVCTKENGEPIEDYTLPPASDTLYINEITGDLIWDSPIDTGWYNIAINVEEWRKGIKIGNIVRDMQIEVYDPDNNPPENPVLHNYCVEAGSLIEFEITSTDPDKDLVSHSSVGGVYIIDNSPATFQELASDSGFVTSRFSWQTNCSHVRKQPYDVIFKVEDVNPELSLVDIDNISITVIGPAPKNLRTVPTNNAIMISWAPSICSEVTGYHIFRREDSFGFIPDSCERGVPEYTGYIKIGETNHVNDTSFIDNNNEQGLPQGIDHCYMIVAVFDDETNSYASEEICSGLIQGIPAFTNVSVNNTGELNGSIYLAWSKPKNLDTIPAAGPFKYLIYHSNDLWGMNFSLIDSLSGLDDTTYVDTFLNTANSPYSYSIELYNDEPGNRFLIGNPQIASSVYINIEASDNKLTINFKKNVPWFNSKYIVSRQNTTTMVFDSIGVTENTSFIDSGLANGLTYCYRVMSIGGPIIEEINAPFINFSNENCAIPIDTIPPCPPILTVNSDCDSLYNEVFWNNPNNSCAYDVIKYNIYYSNLLEGELELIATLESPNDTTYLHYPGNTMAGCYAVTAIDSFMNESAFSILICVDECTNYELPNVFTPNGDGINDIFKPKPYSFVEKVDMKIYNRWGTLVFKTKDPDINWNGKYIENNSFVSSGIYYYICDVYEYRLSGLEVRSIVGFVHIYTEKDAKIIDEK